MYDAPPGSYSMRLDNRALVREMEKDGLDPPGSSRPKSLLDLPPEIRMLIYECVWMLHPKKYTRVGAWFPTPLPSLYITRLVNPYGAYCPSSAISPMKSLSSNAPGAVISYSSTPSLEANHSAPPCRLPPQQNCATTNSNAGNDKTQKDESLWKRQGLLNPHRPPCNYLPSAFLRTCRTVYIEASPLPWCHNEWTFPNWLTSGVAGAEAFLGSGSDSGDKQISHRPAWQRENIRWVRVEAHPDDLVACRRRCSDSRLALSDNRDKTNEPLEKEENEEENSDDLGQYENAGYGRPAVSGGLFGIFMIVPGPSTESWGKGMCARLPGVRGLRLAIVTANNANSSGISSSPSVQRLWKEVTTHDVDELNRNIGQDDKETKTPSKGKKRIPGWIEALRGMASLEQVELQVLTGWRPHEEVFFAICVEEMVNRGREGRKRIIVRAVEKLGRV